MNSNVERWYSMEEICEHLGVSRDTVLVWIKKREMPASKMGRLWKFKVSEVDEWTKSGKAAEKKFFTDIYIVMILTDGGDYLCGVRIVTVKPMKKYVAFAE